MVLTNNQQQYLHRVANNIGIVAIQEVIPDFEIEKCANLTISQFQQVIANVKNYLSIGEEFLPKLLPYRKKIEEKFNKSLEELTVRDLERIIFQFPELNLPYVIKKFQLRPNDYPLKWTTKYEYGIQSSPHCKNEELFYLKFYDLLTIDYDEMELQEIEELVEAFCKKLPSFLFEIYATYRGYHLFLISHSIPYYEPEAIQLMSSLKCDSWYAVFSSKNGFRLRLNPKIRTGKEELYVAKYLRTLGSGQPHPKCLELIQIYQQYLKKGQVDKLPRTVNWTGGFYDSFVEKIGQSSAQPLSDRTSNELLKEANNRVNLSLIKEAGANLVKSLKKPQQLIENEKGYYVALDQYTKTFYVCFRELVMIDLDDHKLTTKIDNIQTYLYQQLDPKTNAIEIYRSLHGYHLFLVDKPRDHSNIDTILFMNKLGCDFYYSIYCYQRGYSVRLNRKNCQQDLDREQNLYTYLGFFGNKSLVNRELKQYVDLHYKLMLKYQNSLINQMR